MPCSGRAPDVRCAGKAMLPSTPAASPAEARVAGVAAASRNHPPTPAREARADRQARLRAATAPPPLAARSAPAAARRHPARGLRRDAAAGGRPSRGSRQRL